ncbi:MAG: winged helix domain-containing protein, partial [Lysobacterales bacterium]
LDSYLAAFLSRFRLAHDPMPPPLSISPEELLNKTQDGVRLLRNPWTRLTWVENPEGARLYAAGQAYDCSVWLAECLCASGQPLIRTDMLDQISLDSLNRLINSGHFQLTGTG